MIHKKSNVTLATTQLEQCFLKNKKMNGDLSHSAKIHQETQAAMKKANNDMKKFYDRKHKPEEYCITSATKSG